ncbi:MAG: DUF6491 family protein [Porticoccaceae bacterium]
MRTVLPLLLILSTVAANTAPIVTESAMDSAMDSVMDSVTDSATEESQDISIIDRLRAIDDVNGRDWGIRNGCISLRRIRSINFIDDQSAVIQLGRDKEVILRLRRECRGIGSEAFIYKTRGHQLCERFDSLRLVTTERDCLIQSIEPYLKIEQANTVEEN